MTSAVPAFKERLNNVTAVFLDMDGVRQAVLCGDGAGIATLEVAYVINAGDEPIGALRVSGAPGGDKDEACARAARDKVADRLK